MSIAESPRYSISIYYCLLKKEGGGKGEGGGEGGEGRERGGRRWRGGRGRGKIKRKEKKREKINKNDNYKKIIIIKTWLRKKSEIHY